MMICNVLTSTLFLVAATVAVESATNPKCKCAGANSDAVPPASYFEEKDFPSNPPYGSYCTDWDKGGKVPWAIPCLEGGADHGLDWCTDPWCFVSADSECDEEGGAYNTVFFANTTYSDSLKFSVSVCTVYDGSTVPSGDGSDMESTSGEASSSTINTGSMALVASAVIIATSVII
jgi:hypothetical protein